MIGQQRLINEIKSYNIKTFPQTLLLLGNRGCGKHLLVNQVISPHLKLDVIDITKNISFEYILEVQLRAIPAIYLINTTLITEKEQNVILKFIEEPVSNSFIILLTEDKNQLLDTVLNRCVVYSFESYTIQELSSFIKYEKEINKELALKISTTPGQLLETDEGKLESLYELVLKITNKIKDATLPNTLSISDKMNYKDNINKFDINMFFNSLILALTEEYIKNNNEFYFKLYNKVSEYKSMLNAPKINKEVLMDNFLITIWKLAQN